MATDRYQNYRPYNKITICGNLLEGGGDILSFGNDFPIRIGRGTPPQVWLSAISEKNPQSLIPIVTASVSTSDSIIVTEILAGTVVFYKSRMLLSVTQVGEDWAEIDTLDLRPIGLNIFGNDEELNVGNVSMKRTSVKSAGVMFALG